MRYIHFQDVRTVLQLKNNVEYEKVLQDLSNVLINLDNLTLNEWKKNNIEHDFDTSVLNKVLKPYKGLEYTEICLNPDHWLLLGHADSKDLDGFIICEIDSHPAPILKNVNGSVF